MTLGSPFLYFSDAVLRAPTIGCMLMCLAASLVGVIVFLKKESLIGESLSHAAYPGVMLGVLLAGALSIDENQELWLAIFIMSGAFCCALLGLWTIYFLETRLKVRSDSALCFVLSTFFGIGLTLASQIQFTYTSLYRQIQIYLYGQAATMTDVHIAIYAVLTILILFVIIFFYKELQTIVFDQEYAKTLGINTRLINAIFFVLIALAVVIGIRSVGVVLMSGMLVAPAAAARQYTNKLYLMFMLAAFFAVVSGFLGNYISAESIHLFALPDDLPQVVLPTGPAIVIVASFICIFSLLFAPKRGLLVRLMRIIKFRYQCMCENLLKAIWRSSPSHPVPFREIEKYQSASPWYLKFILWRLEKQGWILHQTDDSYLLTTEGLQRAAKIVRLHRLWEVYLADYMGVGTQRVHRSAEEMEHILTPEIEQELTKMLQNPRYDPHNQPIPK